MRFGPTSWIMVDFIGREDLKTRTSKKVVDWVKKLPIRGNRKPCGMIGILVLTVASKAVAVSMSNTWLLLRFRGQLRLVINLRLRRRSTAFLNKLLFMVELLLVITDETLFSRLFEALF